MECEMEDLEFQRKYDKYKRTVKQWENEFKLKNGRIPSKYDIREAAHEIRASYKMYYKLKTSFLERTLNDVLSDDGYDVTEITQNFSLNDSTMDTAGAIAPTTSNSTPLSSGLTALIHGTELEDVDNNKITNTSTTSALSMADNVENHVDLNCVQNIESNIIAWDNTVCNKPAITKPALKSMQETKSLCKSSLNKKHFTKINTFSKRNPRKSLLNHTHNNNNSSSNSNIDNKDNELEDEVQLPDLEFILKQKAKEQQEAAALAANPLLNKINNNSHNQSNNKESADMPKMQLNSAWLERNMLNFDKSNSSAKFRQNSNNDDDDNNKTTTTPITYGLCNINVQKLLIPIESTNAHINNNNKDNIEIIQAADSSSNSDAVVSGSESEGESKEYRHIVKKRRLNRSISMKVEIPKSEDKTTTTTTNIIEESPPERQKKMKGKRNPLVANKKSKTTTTATTSTSRSSRSSCRVKKSNSKVLLTAEKSENPKKPKVNSQKSRKVAPHVVVDNEEQAEEEVEEMVPDIEGLKCALRLESGEITYVPRSAPLDIEAAENLIQHYINDELTKCTKTASVAVVVNEKNAASRKLLENKIQAGKLNENFVRINMLKKRYTRGKKPLNYSKYKKQVWKDKKRAAAALTGPDMDMRGCDGGVLTCYNCGQAGHFAQNCKQTGDKLMALQALSGQEQEEPSDFLTLEEAQNMAQNSKMAVAVPNLITELKQSSPTPDVLEFKDKEHNNDHHDKHKDDDDDKDHVEGEEGFQTSDDDDLYQLDINAAVEKHEEEQQQILNSKSHIKDFVGHRIPEDFLIKAGLDASSYSSNSKHSGCVKPLYDLNDDGSIKDVTPEVLETLNMFGHTDFRKGQDRAVMRILSGMSTLVTLSTGSGKSLCYQLPAYLYSRKMGWITLVISPLVSLMEDQVSGVPNFLRVHCLHTNQTPTQRIKIMEAIRLGQVDILLVSPEAVVAGERSTGFGAILRQLPPIAFACIDEAHCVSQWSHNFRPSYLMICKVLRKNLGVNTLLGLTATATMPTRTSIIEHLGITDGMAGIISDIPMPDNLLLSVSKDVNRDAALLQLLQSSRFACCQSIIVYCTRREECDRIAGFLRTTLQDHEVTAAEAAHKSTSKRKRKNVNWHAEPYHAGMAASRRRTIQNAFMNNDLRIVVATIAFGMGINKPDIRAIIHYNMPRNFESYVQEVGRSGRDGKPAHCHLFLDAHGNDQFELRRHIYANSIDRHVIRKLLQNIFVPCSCAINNPQAICPGHEIGFSQDSTVEMLDIPAENISTLLCYLELETRWRIQILSSAYTKAKVISYGGAKDLKLASKECPPLAMAIALEMKRGIFKIDSNIIEFSVIEIAAAIGWNSGVVKHQLKNLEWKTVNGRPKRSTISVTYFDLGFRLRAPGDFNNGEIDDALNTLYGRSVHQEQSQLMQLQYTFQGLCSVAYSSYLPCTKSETVENRSEQLKGIIRDYFRNDLHKDSKLEINSNHDSDEQVQNDVRAIINMYPDNNFSGRNIARIFHGISSPNYPAVMWGRCKFWRAHSTTDFNHILKLANEVIVKCRL